MKPNILKNNWIKRRFKLSIGKLLFNEERVPTYERMYEGINERTIGETKQRTNYTQSKTTLKYFLLTWLLMLQWYILVRNDTCQKIKHEHS